LRKPQGWATRLNAFTHDSFHVVDTIGKATYGDAYDAAKAGDDSINPGGKDTMGGTAQKRTNKLLEGLGGAANKYTANSGTDEAASQIIALGQLIDDSRGFNFQTEGASINGALEPPESSRCTTSNGFFGYNAECKQ
jgi:hypothetical protein